MSRRWNICDYVVMTIVCGFIVFMIVLFVGVIFGLDNKDISKNCICICCE